MTHKKPKHNPKPTIEDAISLGLTPETLKQFRADLDTVEIQSFTENYISDWLKKHGIRTVLPNIAECTKIYLEWIKSCFGGILSGN